MEFQVLGHLAVGTDGVELPLGGPQQRLVLARLIVADGDVVSADRLIDDIWGDDPPTTARKTIQGYVHHLRTQIGERLATVRAGYLLRTDRVVDALRFTDAHDAARAERDPTRTRSLLVEALGMWRGPAYADLREFTCLAGEIGQLEDRRLAAVGDRIDADLVLGRHRLVVGELDVLTAEHPLDEGFRRRHMLALYGAGRHVEALRSYERYRRHVRDELGLEPGDQLRRLEHQILNHDVELGPTSVGMTLSVAAAPAGVRGYELRELLASTGRSKTYRAYQRGIGRQVVVRIVDGRVVDDPAFIAEFARSAQRIASLDHPSLRDVLDTWREPGAAYLVSRWLDGGSLHDAVSERIVAWPEVYGTLLTVGEVLATAHNRGAIHGRVHARNVLFDGGGRPHLADFAIPAAPGDSVDRDRHDLAVLARRAYLETVGDDPDPQVVALLERALSDAPAHATIEEFLAALGAATGVRGTSSATATATVRNPYKGLHPFGELDAADFFGRDELVERLVERLHQHRMVAVVGPSGSGKSSAVRAGLLPRVRARGDPPTLVASMYPGADPFEELANALRSVGRDHEQLLQRLVSGPTGLHGALGSVLPSSRSELVLVVDQLEELFTAVDDPHTCALFLDSLVHAIGADDARLRVVVTLRADFFDRPLEHPAFGGLLELGLVPVTSMSVEQLRLAIVEPAASVGVTFESGLPDLVIGDVLDQPGGLPLLQYTLTELFERRTQAQITFAAYVEIGGVSGAVGRRAEQVHDSLSDAGRRAIQPALLRLVTVDDEARDLRRRVALHELMSSSSDASELEAATTSFASERLLTIDRDPLTRSATVEVAHEALLREWPRLRGWIEAQRDDLITRRRLHAALADWVASQRDDSYLPTGGRLDELLRWADSTAVQLTANEREFLGAARAAAAAAAAADHAQREREARANRRLRVLVRAVVAVAFVAVIAGGTALVQRNRAATSASDAEAQALAAGQARVEADFERLVALARTTDASDPTVGLLVALEAGRMLADGTVDTSAQREVAARDALHRTLTARSAFRGSLASDTIGDITVLDDGQRFVTYTSTSVDVWNVGTRTKERSWALPGQTERTLDPIFLTGVASGDGRVFAAGRPDGITLVDLASGATLGRIDRSAGSPALAMSPDGTRLAAGFGDGVVEVWAIDDVPTLVARHQRPAHVGDVAWRPDGTALAIGTYDGGTALWRPGDVSPAWVDDGVAPPQIDNGAWGLLFSHDGRRLVVSTQTSPAAQERAGQSGARAIRVLDTANGTDLVDPIPDAFTRVRIGWRDAAETTVVANPSSAGPVTAFDVVDGRDLGVLGDPKTANSFGLGVMRDLGLVVTAGTGGIELRSLDGAGPLESIAAAPPTQVAAMANGSSLIPVFSDDGRLASSLLVGSEPVVARAIDLDHPAGQTTPLTPDDPPFLVFGAGPYSLHIGAGGFVVRLGIDGPAQGPAITSPGTYQSVSASPTGDRLVLVHRLDGATAIGLYDVATGDEVAILQPDIELIGPFINGEFSRDGRVLVVGSGTQVVAFDARTGALLWSEDSGNLTPGPAGTLISKATVFGSQLTVATASPPFDAIGEPISAQPAGVVGVDVSPDESLVAVVGRDATVGVWDLESRQPLGHTLPSARNAWTAWSPDGTQLAVPLDDHYVIWNFDVSTWVDIACQTAGRNLTADEWETFGPRTVERRATCPRYAVDERTG
jgi:DNA-binding SARP family transcriptional activator/WD40 repeat protein/tRNA A-37 threonylcarbamoyl transferase component Bud32